MSVPRFEDRRRDRGHFSKLFLDFGGGLNGISALVLYQPGTPNEETRDGRLHLIHRRTLLTDLGRGAFALAVVGIAAVRPTSSSSASGSPSVTGSNRQADRD